MYSPETFIPVKSQEEDEDEDDDVVFLDQTDYKVPNSYHSIFFCWMYVSRNVEILGRKFLPLGQMKNRAMLLESVGTPVVWVSFDSSICSKHKLFSCKAPAPESEKEKGSRREEEDLESKQEAVKAEEDGVKVEVIDQEDLMSQVRNFSFNLFDTCSLLLG